MGLVGYIAIVLVGITLAVIGGGGSILTVPILVYLFKLPADISTSYSLFLVGVSAAVAAFQYGRLGLISYRTGLIFTIPAFIGVFGVRKFLMPLIPAEFSLFSFFLTKDKLIMSVFAVIMLLASVSMIRGRKDQQKPAGNEKNLNVWLVVLEGLLVGGLTGFVGAGGGFLIIPALVLLAGLPIKVAIGTSLMIIAIKSLFGFTGDIGVLDIDWLFLGQISAISVVGIFIGSQVARYIKSEVLKPLFGYFVLLMGVFIIFQQLSDTRSLSMSVPNIEAAIVQNLQEDPGGVILIDVREPDEFAEVASPYAKNFPLSVFEPQQLLNSLQITTDKQEVPLYFICRSGRRSLTAAEKLFAAGYENVYNVEGGMIRWLELGLPSRN